MKPRITIANVLSELPMHSVHRTPIPVRDIELDRLLLKDPSIRSWRSEEGRVTMSQAHTIVPCWSLFVGWSLRWGMRAKTPEHAVTFIWNLNDWAWLKYPSQPLTQMSIAARLTLPSSDHQATSVDVGFPSLRMKKTHNIVDEFRELKKLRIRVSRAELEAARKAKGIAGSEDRQSRKKSGGRRQKNWTGNEALTRKVRKTVYRQSESNWSKDSLGNLASIRKRFPLHVLRASALRISSWSTSNA
jgi:hypothetical protein